MYKKGFISVIVPVYNVEKYLRQCLDSIINQTYRDLDIILVDDGSTDNSGSICDEYAEKDSRIRVIHKENGGLSSARNAGLDLIDTEGGGEFLAYVDSDDFLELDIYEKCIDKFRVNLETNLIIFSICSFLSDDLSNSSNKLYNNIENILREDILEQYETGHTWNGINSCVWNKVYKTQDIVNYRFIEGRVYEDADYTYRIFTKVNKSSTISDIGYYYRNNNIESISHSIKDNIIDLFYNIEELRNNYQESKEYRYYVGANTLLLLIATDAIYSIKKLKIYPEFKKLLKRASEHPIRVPNNKMKKFRFKLLMFNPELFCFIDTLIFKLYNIIKK